MNPTPEMLKAARDAFPNKPFTEAIEAAVTAALALLPGQTCLHGPYGYLNGARALTEDTWELQNDQIKNDDEYFSIPLYAKVDISYPVSAAPAPLLVAVKALEWTARNADGTIQIAHVIPMQYWAWELGEFGYWSWGTLTGREVYGGIEGAKAAAQADYETRIRSALSSPVGGTEETFTRAQMLAEVERRVDRALLAKSIHASISAHDFAMMYEFRDDGGDYTPTDGERAMIEDAINGFLGDNKISPTPASDIAALREISRHKTELLGYGNVYRMQGGSFELGDADVDNLEDVHPWAKEFEEHVGIAEIRLLPDTAGKSGADVLAALQHAAKGERGQ